MLQIYTYIYIRSRTRSAAPRPRSHRFGTTNFKIYPHRFYQPPADRTPIGPISYHPPADSATIQAPRPH